MNQDPGHDHGAPQPDGTTKETQITSKEPPGIFGWIDDHFKEWVVVTIALVTVLAGLVAYLEAWASNHYAATVRQGQTLAMDALGHDMSSRQQEGYDAYLYATWNEWDWRRSRALGLDPAASERAAGIVDIIAPLTPLVDEQEPYYDPETGFLDSAAYHVDTNLITTTALLEQRTFTIVASNTWNAKADGYVTILTLVAVSLFLLGLAPTLQHRLRYLFAGSGLLLVGVALLSTLFLTVRPVVPVPHEAIDLYAQGVGQAWVGDYPKAVKSFDAAIEAHPGYANAYYQSGAGHLVQGEYAQAIERYQQAIEAGRADRSAYWELGWTHYLMGDYGPSVAASRRALELDPYLVPVVMNIATSLLADGQYDAARAEIEKGLAMTAAPDSPVPAAWNQTYLREAINDLDRLIGSLDGQTGFHQEPDLSQVRDPAGLKTAAEEARRRLKEGLVAIQVANLPFMERSGARLSPLTFARASGWSGAPLGQGDAFARGELSLLVSVSFDDLPQGAIVSRRVTRQWSEEPGASEALPTMGNDWTWEGQTQGSWQHPMDSPWPGDRGLYSGRYTVEYYVNGQLLQSGEFAVADEETAIISPIVFAGHCASGGIPQGPDRIFPSGAAVVNGTIYFSGIPAGSAVHARWLRDGQPYYTDQLTAASDWGSLCYALNNVPAGTYHLELFVEGQVEISQAAEFEVVPAEDYLLAIGPEPDDWRFLLDLGRAQANSGEYQAAAARYETATQLEPECALCYYQWWAALTELGQPEEAITKLQQAIELNPERYSYLADLGGAYYDLGAEAEAIAAFRRAIPANPAYVYNAWGNALFALERYNEAVVKYQQSIELNPDDEVVHANVGTAFDRMGAPDKAIAAYEQALAVAPAYAHALNLWGDILYEQEQYPAAMAKYQEAIDASPGTSLYHSNLGWAAYQAGDHATSSVAFQQAVDLFPQGAGDWNKWGDALYAQELYAQAASKYEVALELAPSEPLYASNLGWALLLADDYGGAAAAYQRAVELDPSLASDWNMWGRALYELGEFLDAAEKHVEALKLSPDEALYASNLAWAYYQLGQTEDAIATFERAAGLASASGDAELVEQIAGILEEIR